MYSAIVPNGSAPIGISPKVIIMMLITRPRISGVAESWVRVMLSDIYIELTNPIMIRNGTATGNIIEFASPTNAMPQNTPRPSSKIPRLSNFRTAASPSVPISAPTPIIVISMPRSDEFTFSASRAQTGSSANSVNPKSDGRNAINMRPRRCTSLQTYRSPSKMSLPTLFFTPFVWTEFVLTISSESADSTYIAEMR